MKKILVLMIAFVAIALLPQTVMAQNDTKPAKEKMEAKKKEAVAPVKKENVDAAKQKSKQTAKKPEYTKTNVGAKPSPQVAPNVQAKPATKRGPYEAVITPLKNPRNKKVTIGKKVEKGKAAGKKKKSNEKINIPPKE